MWLLSTFKRSQRSRHATKTATYYPRLEHLEGRILPARAVWTGAGADSNWGTKEHWSRDDNRLSEPLPADTLVFDKSAKFFNSTVNKPYTITALNVTWTGAINVSKSLTITQGPSFLGGGLIAGEGNLIFQGNATWSGGTMTGKGKTLIDKAATLTIVASLAPNVVGPPVPLVPGQVVLDGRSLEVRPNSTVRWTFGTIQLTNAATIVNSGTFQADLVDTGLISGDAKSVFSNSGVFNKTGIQYADLDLTFNSVVGTVNVKGGAAGHPARLHQLNVPGLGQSKASPLARFYSRHRDCLRGTRHDYGPWGRLPVCSDRR